MIGARAADDEKTQLTNECLCVYGCSTGRSTENGLAVPYSLVSYFRDILGGYRQIYRSAQRISAPSTKYSCSKGGGRAA